ncbi:MULTISPECIES: ATP-grasp domain-containing protein [Blautia]|uniref:ATP-grasp domain-containing protein n=1 Tax=Blautia TaxID=572511 RepID=UPI001D08E9DB|nr:ATP-grasp domain-containing protein [Blautia marasmi]MCB6194985.1 ATP-grasp domain-containing protein [Blautia marasmi]
MMKQRLLILGSLREFVQLIQLAKSRGIYTIVCDGYPDSIGKRYADKAYDIDVGDTDRIVSICQLERVDGIITSFSDYLFECMIKIANKAGLKCYFSPEKLDYYRNKDVMKQMFHELSIPTAKYVRLAYDFTDNDLNNLEFPVVVKPIDKYGSRGVLVLYSIEEIRKYFNFICATSEIKEILVEEYNEGYEFNMMSWILDGKVHVISIADREKTPVCTNEIPISSRNVYPSRLINYVYEEAKGILQKVANYTGQTSGALSMQFFWSPGETISVCEVAGRFFGYEHELVDYCCGLKVEDLLLDYLYDEMSLRKNIKVHSPFFAKNSAVLYFHGKSGLMVDNQDAARKISSIKGVKDAWLFYRSGERIIPHGVNPYAVRYYISEGSRTEIDRITKYIYEHISIVSPEGENVLYENKIPKYPE